MLVGHVCGGRSVAELLIGHVCYDNAATTPRHSRPPAPEQTGTWSTSRCNTRHRRRLQGELGDGLRGSSGSFRAIRPRPRSRLLRRAGRRRLGFPRRADRGAPSVVWRGCQDRWLVAPRRDATWAGCHDEIGRRLMYRGHDSRTPAELRRQGADQGSRSPRALAYTPGSSEVMAMRSETWRIGAAMIAAVARLAQLRSKTFRTNV